MDAANDRCAEQHFGLWAVEPQWFGHAVSAVKAGTWKPQASEIRAQEGARRFLVEEESGIAMIGMRGHMTKGESSFGGASTIRTRRAIREAVDANDVRGIMLVIESPGGTVAGTDELAAEVRQARKPIRAHIEDLGASAAYWVASQADRVTANRTAQVGSIGTLAVLEDVSGMAERLGIKVHVVSTGAMKGAGVPGTEITKEILEDVQSRVDAVNAFFLEAVQTGRSLTDKELRAVSDGRVFPAPRAVELGLVDQVADLDQAMADFRGSLEPPRDTRAAIQRREIRMRGGR